MKNQVLSINQMQHLKELGVDTSKASMCHVKFDGENEFSNLLPNNQELFERLLVVKYIPAFTLQDILDLLPKDICKEGCTWAASLYIDYENNRIAYGNTDRYGFEIYHERIIEETLIDAAYEMLCWCIENGYVRTGSN